MLFRTTILLCKDKNKKGTKTLLALHKICSKKMMRTDKMQKMWSSWESNPGPLPC
jgi:hypothetical protein